LPRILGGGKLFAIMTPMEIQRLKRQYAGKRVTVDARRPELTRFAGMTGSVKAINFNGQALVEFDGPNNSRYDIAPEFLRLEPTDEQG
jgi:hypothetical protein